MTEIKLFEHRPDSEAPGRGCDCPHTETAQIENLPLIETIAAIFPDEWLAFIISPTEDDDFEPLYGKLIAHSPHPDEVYDAVNTVLWNQHVYVFFNGSFEALQASYGQSWHQSPEEILSEASVD